MRPTQQAASAAPTPRASQRGIVASRRWAAPMSWTNGNGSAGSSPTSTEGRRGGGSKPAALEARPPSVHAAPTIATSSAPLRGGSGGARTTDPAPSTKDVVRGAGAAAAAPSGRARAACFS
jgi:hypothetical protein